MDEAISLVKKGKKAKKKDKETLIKELEKQMKEATITPFAKPLYMKEQWNLEI